MQLSAGICFIDDGEETFEKILEGANLARKLAKEQNVGAVVYRDDMRKKRDEGIRITGRFYAALQRGEFEVYLQPKFLLREERVYGAEALARWRLESGEILSPARFIPALENIGYIVDLDFYILEQLLRAMRRWRDSGRELFTISTRKCTAASGAAHASFICSAAAAQYTSSPYPGVCSMLVAASLSKIAGWHPSV